MMSNSLRVLHVHSGNLFGGIETMMLAMVRHRELCGELEPSFALCFKGRLAEELAGLGAEIHDLGEVKIRRLDSVWRARQQLAALLRGRHFDVVITHSSWSQAVFGPVIREAGLPLVNYLHGLTDEIHWLERLARRTPPDLLIANSRFTAGKAKKLYPHVPCEVVYPLFAPAVSSQTNLTREIKSCVRAELNTDDCAIVIIQVSRMEAWKGHKLHLQALGLLRHVPNWVCWQVGGAHGSQETDYLGELKMLAKDLGIADRVRFLGERKDVPRLLAAADIHCQPNLSPEPFGLTFVEALAAGLPVVTTAMGGALEIMDDSCGLLTPPGNWQALANVLERLIEHPDLRGRFGAAGRIRARQLGDARQQLERIRNLCSTLTLRAAA